MTSSFAPVDLLRHLTQSVSARVLPRAEPLASPILAEHKTMTTHRGQLLSYYASHAAKGRPLVLLHSVNACASSYEMRPMFEHFRGERPVYALDLPGFGLSGREERPYTIDLFVDSIRELLARVCERADAADVVASSLTSELVARAALDHKELVHSLALVSPTGFGKTRAPPSPFVRRALDIACRPPVGDLFFGAIVSQPSVAYFLRKSFAGRPDPGLAEYAYVTAHQPGASYAPLAFVHGDLFTTDVRETVYDKLTTPTLVVYDEDGYVRFDALETFVSRHPKWEARRIAGTKGLPQFERMDELARVMQEFWRHAAARGH